MSINKKIIISKEQILEKYLNLDDYFKSVIATLYGEETTLTVKMKCFECKNIVNKEGDNDIKILEEYQNKTGVYIFLDNDNIPVYIGLAGKVGGSHDIKQRLQKQFNCNGTNSTLYKNIEEIENILQNSSVPSESMADKKELILEFAPKLLVIEVGELNINGDVLRAQSLETLLISLFNSKYNK